MTAEMKRWIQPGDLPKCLVVEGDENTNLLEINDNEQYGGLATFPSEETARRVAALWNACAGIPTEALESGALADALENLESLCSRREPGEEPGGWEIEVARKALCRLGRLP